MFQVAHHKSLYPPSHLIRGYVPRLRDNLGCSSFSHPVNFCYDCTAVTSTVCFTHRGKHRRCCIVMRPWWEGAGVGQQLLFTQAQTLEKHSVEWLEPCRLLQRHVLAATSGSMLWSEAVARFHCYCGNCAPEWALSLLPLGKWWEGWSMTRAFPRWRPTPAWSNEISCWEKQHFTFLPRAFTYSHKSVWLCLTCVGIIVQCFLFLLGQIRTEHIVQIFLCILLLRNATAAPSDGIHMQLPSSRAFRKNKQCVMSK